MDVDDGNSGDCKWRIAFEDEDDCNSRIVTRSVFEDDRKVIRSLDRGRLRVNPGVLEAAVDLLGGDLLGAPKMNEVTGKGSQSCWTRSAIGNIFYRSL